ncbi:uncharacterized protein F4822DRAFT_344909 [Hypoxylon trugodes]|uniref:uncharacterized protein n=1 Tax=Hypoxylon trugodes TaxID=326681 RepID=UPI0021A15F48|nr:uncharacterized protein F4822DRAFT_344909 [Hypoxylon trugodes]KAI1385458.1 hypothetical protein F4822DRAFT_344909 [Hypoxylon trugodes]
MGRIYSSAHTVYAWLGEGTNQTDEAMEYLARGGLPFSRCITSYIGHGVLSDKRIPSGYSMSIRLPLGKIINRSQIPPLL